MTTPAPASAPTASSSPETAKPACCCGCGAFAAWLPSGASLGFLVLRLWIAVRAIVTGIEKFSGFKMTQKELLDEFGNPDASGALVEVKTKVYGLSLYHGMPPSLEDALRAEPFMPGWMLTAYGYALGPLLIITGLALLLGMAPRLTLFIQGIIYVSLTLGLILLNQDSGIAWLGTHVILIALALKWVEHNRWALHCPRCRTATK